jgi:hypothetical protein
MQERLPQLLQERLPLLAYQAEPSGRTTCCVRVALAAGADEIALQYSDLPQPDEDGVFELDGQPYVVVPAASQQELDRATMRCVGEQLYAYVEQRLGQAPPDLSWDVELARAWLPLDAWISDFMREYAQRLAVTNWLSRHTHLRRLVVPGATKVVAGGATKVVAAGQLGRTCPFETPEGPNMGRVLTIAVGAEIRGEKLVIVDDRPQATLGLCASAIPLLEHNDANRLLMGANMLRQWVVQSVPEPALVQTGLEPDVPDFWIGRNLLTAFVSWGADTYADGIVVSESCARRFDAPYPLEAGDKMSNRAGTKGVVSRVLPDDQMPHLSDGTPVDVVYNFIGLHVRMNFGQVREAVLGRIARARGEAIFVPPFGAPGEDELRAWLQETGQPEMERLTLGRDGPPLEQTSTVGWVYWGRLFHLARDKVQVFVDVEGQVRGQVRGTMEYSALSELGAYENMREGLNTVASRREDAGTLTARLAAGPVEPGGPPTPMFSELAARLRVAGIQASLEGGELAFDFGSSLHRDGGEDVVLSSPRSPCLRGEKSLAGIKLARPVPHPWLRERSLTEIGAYSVPSTYDSRSGGWVPVHPLLRGEGQAASPSEAYAQLVEANDRLARMLASGAPESLVQDAQERLESYVRALFDVLLTHDHLRFHERLLFSARTVIAPGADLELDQVGLADEIAWALFGPLVARELGSEVPVRAYSARATQVLDEIMSRSWVIVNRAPTLTPTAHLAFHPIRDPGSVIRLHPLVCPLLDADFDGDQVAVFLPITAAAQREAGERLSIAAHLARDPGLLEVMLVPPEALWGLAHLGLSEAGRREIAEWAGLEVGVSRGLITQATLVEAMRAVLKQGGPDAALAALMRLTRRGYEGVRASGASMSAFIGSALRLPPAPQKGDGEVWDLYREELAEQILASTDYAHPELGPQRLAVSIRSRGRRHLPLLTGPLGPTTDAEGNTVVVRHSRVEGLMPEELYASAAGARKGLAQYWQRWEKITEEMRQHDQPGPYTVLARARRARHPGVVFARAAANGEVDPLVDADSRLLVGLAVP